MKNKLFLKSILFLGIILVSKSVYPQGPDMWFPSEKGGFGKKYNDDVKFLKTFKGHLYAGMGGEAGEVYRTNNGAEGSWIPVFDNNDVFSEFIDAMDTTGAGGGYIYISARGYMSDKSIVYKSSSGNPGSWTEFYRQDSKYDNFSYVIPFKDSVYVVENDNYNGDVIRRGKYDNTAVWDTSSTWQTVLALGSNTNVKSYTIFNGRLFIGTDNGGKIKSTQDGVTWTAGPPDGFGDFSNTEISALGVHGSYIYAGTRNTSEGAELWKKGTTGSWSKVTEFPGTDEITSITSTTNPENGNVLWITVTSGNYSDGEILKSTNGSTFTVSNNNGFGEPGNTGENAVTAVFKNHLFYGTRNAGGGQPKIVRAVSSTGGQIWSTCLGSTPAFSLGSDATICDGQSHVFDAGTGFIDYHWDSTNSNQTISVNIAGDYRCVVTGSNGCRNTDVVHLTTIASPSITVINPYTDTTICKGDSIYLNTSVISNDFYTIPFSRSANKNIYGYSPAFDTLHVAGVNPDSSITSFVAVKIDSLFHPFGDDLRLNLHAPDGSYILLAEFASGANYMGTEFRADASDPVYAGAAPYTGIFRSDFPFSNLSGNVNGAWVLEVNNYGGDPGVIKGWSLQFAQPDTNLTYSWSPNTGLISTTTKSTWAIPAATTQYTLTATNDIGCSTTTTLDTIHVPNIDVTSSASNICAGVSVTLTATGGNTYDWSPSGTLSSSTGNTVTATPTGTTTYYAMDTVNGCVIQDSITIHVTSPLVALPGAAQTICSGDTATFNGSASGGAGNYSYSWNGGGNTYNVKDLIISATAPASYILTVTDTMGCSGIDSVLLSVNALPSVSIISSDADDVLCAGDSVTLSGNGAHTYNWDNGISNGVKFQANVTTNYQLTGTDTITGCVNHENIMLMVNTLPSVNANASTTLVCPGSTVTLYGSGASTYTWDNGVTDSTPTSINATTTYNVTGTDTNNCVNTASITVTLNPALSVDAGNHDTICEGSNTIFVASANGGTPGVGYTYSWYDGSNNMAGDTLTTSPSSSINYTLTVIDSAGCSATDWVSLHINSLPVVNVSATDVDLCLGDTVTLTATGGASTYTWSNGVIDGISFNPTSTRTYTAIGTTNGCSDSASIMVTVNSLPVVTANTTGSTSVCPGTNVILYGGGANTYIWSHSKVNNTPFPLDSTTTFVVTGIDTNGCVNTANIQLILNSILPPITLTAATDSSKVICLGDSVTFNGFANGGSPSYSYSWYDGTNTIPGQNITISPATANTYTLTLTVTDAFACSSTSSTNLTVNTLPSTSVSSSDETCNGAMNGTATVTASGGTAPYTYAWNDPTNQTVPNAVSLAAGSYTVTVADANNCQANDYATVSQPATLNVNVSSTPVLCAGENNGTASAVPTGGTSPFSFSWNDPANQSNPMADSLAAGNYTVTVTDANNCQATNYITVGQPPVLSVSVSANAAKCFGINDGNASAVASGGVPPFSFSWNDPANQYNSMADSLAAGSYTVIVIDSNNCQASNTVVVSEPAALIINVSSTPVLCAGGDEGTASAFPSGGTPPFSFSWNDPSNQINSTAYILNAGSYTVIVTDANNCEANNVAIVSEPPVLSINVSSTPVHCAGGNNGTVTAMPVGGTPPYTFNWNDPLDQHTAVADSLFPASYTVLVVDSNNCQANNTVNVGQLATLGSTVSSTSVNCFGGNDGTAFVTPSGGTPPFTFTWNDPNNQNTSLADSLTVGSYTVTVKDSNNCQTMNFIAVSQPTSPLNITISAAGVTCNGAGDGSATANVSGGTQPYSYAWNDPSNQTNSSAINLVGGSYNLIVTDANNCIDSNNVSIIEPSAIVANAGIPQTICFADTAQFAGSATGGVPGYIYSWDDGTQTYTGQSVAIVASSLSANITLTVTDTTGCSANATNILNAIPSTDIYGNITDSSGTAPVYDGNVILLRYLPYLTHFDTIQQVSPDASGNFHFNGINTAGIDHGQYLIEVFADTTNPDFATAVPTYFGFGTSQYLWGNAGIINHDCDKNDTINFKLIQKPGMTGNGIISGLILEDKGFGRAVGDPVPGLDVKLGKNPGGALIASTNTDSSGIYTFSGVPEGNYTIYVDIPGVGQDSSYSVTIDASNNEFTDLNYMVDSSTVNILADSLLPTPTAISNPKNAAENKFMVYPNPFKGNTTIEYTIAKEANVHLEVFNVLGEKMKILVNGKQIEGNYKYNLNDQSNNLNSGLYYVTLTVDGKSSSQQIIILE